jgi:hypothetical protein
MFYQFAARSKWMIRQRTKIVTHRPTGTQDAIESRIAES